MKVSTHLLFWWHFQSWWKWKTGLIGQKWGHRWLYTSVLYLKLKKKKVLTLDTLQLPVHMWNLPGFLLAVVGYMWTFPYKLAGNYS